MREMVIDRAEDPHLDAKVEAIITAWLDCAGDVAQPGPEGAHHLMLASAALTVRFAIAGCGSIESAQEMLTILLNDYFDQASVEEVAGHG